MPSLKNEQLDDEPSWERMESFAGGEDSFRRSTLIDPDQCQKLVNVIVRDNFEARTRPGADSLGVFPPLKPLVLAATAVSATQINLTWQNVSGASFVLSRSLVSGSGYVVLATLAVGVIGYHDTGLNSSTNYYYVVQASTSDGGLSLKSNEATAETQAGTPVTPPIAPSSLVATAVSFSQINLTWADNSSDETSFVVSRGLVSGGPYTDIATLAANTTSYSDTGLSSLTGYFYVVRAVNANGNSSNSNQATATTWGGVRLTPPITGNVTVLWYSNNAPVGTYRVYYINGALQETAGNWVVDNHSGEGGFDITYNRAADGSSNARADFPNTITYPSQAAAEASNSGNYVEFNQTLSGCGIGIYYKRLDGNYGANIAGSPNPTFELRRIS